MIRHASAGATRSQQERQIHLLVVVVSHGAHSPQGFVIMLRQWTRHGLHAMSWRVSLG